MKTKFRSSLMLMAALFILFSDGLFAQTDGFHSGTVGFRSFDTVSVLDEVLFPGHPLATGPRDAAILGKKGGFVCRLDSGTSYEVDSNGQETPINTVRYVYDSMGRETARYSSYPLQKGGPLELRSFTSLRYESDGPAERRFHTWKADSNRWDTTQRRQFLYAPDGKLMEEIWENRTGNSQPWNFQYQYLYHYDDSSYLLCVFRNRYQNNQWEKASVDSFFYSTEPQPFQEDSWTWNESNQIWTHTTRRENTYEGNGWLTSRMSVFWSQVNQVWDTSIMATYTYDTYGNPIELNYLRHTDTGWVYNSRTLADYDTDIAMAETQAMNPVSVMGNSVHIQLGTLNQTHENGQWTDDVRIQLYYTMLQGTGLKQIPEIEVRVYSNPVGYMLNIETGQLSVRLIIYDLEGKILLETDIEPGLNSIDISHLPLGFYYLHFYNEDGKKTVPILKN